MRYIPAIVVTIVIFVTISIPSPKIPDTGFSGLDKAAHLFFFGSWSLAVQFGFSIKQRWRWILLAGFALGLTTEVIQLFVKSRSFELLDLLFDTFGLMLAAWSGPTFIPIAEKIWPMSRWAAREKNL